MHDPPSLDVLQRLAPRLRLLLLTCLQCKGRRFSQYKRTSLSQEQPVRASLARRNAREKREYQRQRQLFLDYCCVFQLWQSVIGLTFVTLAKLSSFLDA